jgi:hypothetical protein
MLAPAWVASRRLRCRWGFDCEDILSEEYGEGIDNPAHQALVRDVERTFIPAADYVTTASSLFGPWLSEHYGVTNPHSRITHQQHKRTHPSGVFGAASREFVFVLVDSREDSQHLFASEGKRWAESYTRRFEITRGILRHPFPFLSEPEERAQAFQFLRT